jgi:hypothetical protein
MKIKLTLLLAGVLTMVLAAPMAKRVVIENQRVVASEVIYEPGKPREPYIRPTDQLIVFLDECSYERLDSQTKEKTIRKRKQGEVIWHNKGEDAPQLINLGTKPFRTLVIELK